MQRPARRDPSDQFDVFLAGTSWDRTWQRMRALIEAGIFARRGDGESEASGPRDGVRQVKIA